MPDRPVPSILPSILRRTLLLAALLSSGAVPAAAGVRLLGDFDEGSAPLDMGPGSLLTPIGTSIAFKPSVSTEPALGNAGHSVQISFSSVGDGYALFEFGGAVDLTVYNSLSFWVRGAAGGESFEVSLRRATSPNEPIFRSDVRNFLAGGAATGWQKVVIPLRALMSDYVVNTSTALSDVNAVVFKFPDALPGEVVYVDDMLFHAKSAPVWVESFSDGTEPGPHGVSSDQYDDTGASIARSVDAAIHNSAPASFRVDYAAGSPVPGRASLARLRLDSNRNFKDAMDVTGCDRLVFDVRSVGMTGSVGVALSDDAFAEKIHTSLVGLTGGWQSFTRSISGFGLTSSTNVAEVQFWFYNDNAGRGPSVYNTSTGTLYIDNVRFEDSIPPQAPNPASVMDGTNTVTSGYAFVNVVSTLSATAQSDATDPTIESVRFEHDAMSGGTTWYRVGLSTAVGGASHSAFWNTGPLPVGNTYRLRVIAMDVAGNASTTTFTNLTVGNPPPAAPTALAGVATSTGSALFSWTAPADLDVSSYRIYYDIDAPGAPYAGTGLQEGNSPVAAGAGTSFNLRNLTSGTTYYVAVSAVDTVAQEGALSAPIAFVADITGPAISHAPPSSAVAGQDVVLSLSATDETHVSSATLFYRVAGGGLYTALSFSPAPTGATSYSGAAVVPGASVTTAGLQYFIHTDDGVNVSSFTSAASPQNVPVTLLPAPGGGSVAPVRVVADFDEGVLPLDIGPGSVIDAGSPSPLVFSFQPSSLSEPARGNTGYSLKVVFTPGTTGYMSLDFGAPMDLNAYGALSFWVRGAAGGESFKVAFKEASLFEVAGFRPDVRSFLPGGVDTTWRKVVIPVKSLYSTGVGSPLTAIRAVVFTVNGVLPGQTFYLDDILFHPRAAPVWVDTFNDPTSNKNAFDSAPDPYKSFGDGAFTASMEAASLRLDYAAGSPGPFDAAALLLPLTSAGADVSGCDRFVFEARGAGGASGSLGVGLADSNGNERIHVSLFSLSGAPQTVSRSILPTMSSSFGLASSTNVARAQVWFYNANTGKGGLVNNVSTGTVYVDNVRFEDKIPPASLSQFRRNSTLVSAPYFFGAADTLDVQAGLASDDPTLESVRFEHDGMTAGATWYTVFTSTDNASASRAFTWNAAGLAPGFTYRVRWVAMDVAGNESVLELQNVELNPGCGIASASDVVPPVASHTPFVLPVAAGRALAVPLSVTDDLRVDAATLFYRPQGSVAPYTQAAYPFSGSCSASYAGSAVIPAVAVSTAGVEYYIEATDSRNTVSLGSPGTPFTADAVQADVQGVVGISGGSLSLADPTPGAGLTSVSIPPGALPSSTTISINLLDPGQAPSGSRIGREQPFSAFDFGPHGTVFQKPALVTLRYFDLNQDGRVEDAGTGQDTAVSEQDLRIFFHDGFSWRDVGGRVDADANAVSTPVRHFTLFALFPAGALTDDAVRPLERILTPGGSPGDNDAANFGGSPVGAKIEIYDVSGRLVRRLEDNTVWDGRDSDGKVVEAGLYVYHAEVEGRKVTGSLTVAR